MCVCVCVWVSVSVCVCVRESEIYIISLCFKGTERFCACMCGCRCFRCVWIKDQMRGHREIENVCVCVAVCVCVWVRVCCCVCVCDCLKMGKRETWHHIWEKSTRKKTKMAEKGILKNNQKTRKNFEGKIQGSQNLYYNECAKSGLIQNPLRIQWLWFIEPIHWKSQCIIVWAQPS